MYAFFGIDKLDRNGNSAIKKYMGACALIFATALSFADEADAIAVYDACAQPSPASGRRTFYVDPVKGSMSNDGSAAHPWSTLAEVLDSGRKLVATQAYPSNFQKKRPEAQ